MNNEREVSRRLMSSGCDRNKSETTTTANASSTVVAGTRQGCRGSLTQTESDYAKVSGGSGSLDYGAIAPTQEGCRDAATVRTIAKSESGWCPGSPGEQFWSLPHPLALCANSFEIHADRTPRANDLRRGKIGCSFSHLRESRIQDPIFFPILV